MPEKLQITNTLDALTAQVGNVVRASLETQDIEILRATSDELARLQDFKNKIDNLLTDKLNQEFADCPPGEVKEFGLYKFEKVQKKSASKLDPNKLAELIQDQDLLDSCFEVVKKPLTQAKLAKVFAENQINADVKQLYTQELKNEFEIKFKN